MYVQEGYNVSREALAIFSDAPLKPVCRLPDSVCNRRHFYLTKPTSPKALDRVGNDMEICLSRTRNPGQARLYREKICDGKSLIYAIFQIEKFVPVHRAVVAFEYGLHADDFLQIRGRKNDDYLSYFNRKLLVYERAEQIRAAAAFIKDLAEARKRKLKKSFQDGVETGKAS